jgi:hypothetical protein
MPIVEAMHGFVGTTYIPNIHWSTHAHQAKLSSYASSDQLGCEWIIFATEASQGEDCEGSMVDRGVHQLWYAF